MKASSFKVSALILLLAVIAGWLISTTTNAAPHQDTNGADSYAYHSDKLNVNINMPIDWKDKITAKEDDKSITVSCNNPGGQPVFLYSVTKLDERTWLTVKDDMQGVHVISNKNGQVYFVELTDKTSIKGVNAKEYKAMFANLDEVLANIKVG